MTLAGWSLRFVNFMIDGAFVLSLYMSTLLADMYLWNSFFLRKDAAAIYGFCSWIGMMLALLILLYWFYYFICEVLLGTTFGHHVTRTRIIQPNGQKPSFKQRLMRSIVRLIPVDPFTFFASHPAGWHDTWSHTRIVER